MDESNVGGALRTLYQFRRSRNGYRGDGSAVSLPRLIVGTRHCRLLRLLRLYHSDANGINIICSLTHLRNNLKV